MREGTVLYKKRPSWFFTRRRGGGANSGGREGRITILDLMVPEIGELQEFLFH